METIYEHAGGEKPIHRLEEIFYDKVLNDPVLSKLFTERIPTHVDHLTWFTTESFGGPDRSLVNWGSSTSSTSTVISGSAMSRSSDSLRSI